MGVQRLLVRWRVALGNLRHHLEQALPRSEDYNVTKARILTLETCIYDLKQLVK
jgi:hypothetical protein